MRGFTCKDCKDRKVGCHSTCEKYNLEKAEFYKIKQTAINDRSIEHYNRDRRFMRRNAQLRHYGKTYA